MYDYSNYMMHIDGESLSVRDSRLDQASFNLPEELAQGVLTLRAESAVYAPKTATHPSGWLLKNLTVVVDAERLTDEGRLRIQLRNAGRDVFVISDVSFDQLYDQGRNPKLLSSVELVKRIRNPATGSMTVRQQSLALHSRITRPILSLLTIAIALPMVLRRESPSLIFNLAVCGTVLTATFAATQGFLLLGSDGWLRPDIAAWVPVILTGATTSWTASYVQT